MNVREQFIEGNDPLVSGVSSRLRLERGLRFLLFVALCIELMFGPLAMGIVHDWSVALFEAGAAFVFLTWMMWQAASRRPGIKWNPLFAPMLVLLAIVLVQIALHLSAYRFDTMSELWLYIAYGMLVFAAVQLFSSDDGSAFAVRFVNVMAFFGGLYAVFAVLQGFTSEGHIYWRIKPLAGNIYGAYVNHNHYAGLMELLLPFALVLGFSGSARGAKRILLVFAATLMAASVFLCQSRGGMFAVVVETIFLAMIWFRKFSPKKSAALFVAFFLVTALLLAWVAPQQLGNRMTDIHDPARLLIHRDSLHMFAAHPLIGSGFGTFATAFPRYQAFYDGFFINHAHDDYLELLLETGLVGFGAGVWFIFVLYRQGLRNLPNARQMKPSTATLIGIAALSACTGLLAHSFVDFNLHIPANAALFFVLCSIATVSPANRV